MKTISSQRCGAVTVLNGLFVNNPPITNQAGIFATVLILFSSVKKHRQTHNSKHTHTILPNPVGKLQKEASANSEGRGTIYVGY